MKKGFTLIELLAVIVILAVIAVITTPIIINFVQTARQKAFIDTGYSIISASRVYQADKATNPTNNLKLIINYTENKNVNEIKVKGKLPSAGIFCMSESGKTKLVLWSDKAKGCITKDEDTKKIKIDQNIKEKSECLEKAETIKACTFKEDTNV